MGKPILTDEPLDWSPASSKCCASLYCNRKRLFQVWQDYCTPSDNAYCKWGVFVLSWCIWVTWLTVLLHKFCLSPQKYETINALRFQSNGKQLEELYKGGWKNLPPEGRWWEEALSGKIEETRAENLKLLPETLGVSNGNFWITRYTYM